LKKQCGYSEVGTMSSDAFHFGYMVVLLLLGIALTAWIFRKRLFDRGYRKGQAADPDRVRRDNPPDEWTHSR
jgi:hypothetical protein